MKRLKGWLIGILLVGLVGPSLAFPPGFGGIGVGSSGVPRLPAGTRPSSTGPQHGAPDLINIQGRLTYNDGSLIPAGTHSMAFSIYKSKTGGAPIWSKAYSGDTAIAVDENGVFNAIIGGSDGARPFPVFDTSAHYLEIIVDMERLSPRQRLVSVPYALNARNLINDARRPGRVDAHYQGTAVLGTGTGAHGTGVSGIGDSIGVFGRGQDQAGGSFESTSGVGVYGHSTNGRGVWGRSDNSHNYGIYGENTDGIAIKGISNRSTGVVGQSSIGSGVFGQSSSNTGVSGQSTSGYGVEGITAASNRGGVYARNTGDGPALELGGGKIKIDDIKATANLAAVTINKAVGSITFTQRRVKVRVSNSYVNRDSHIFLSMRLKGPTDYSAYTGARSVYVQQQWDGGFYVVMRPRLGYSDDVAVVDFLVIN